MKNILTFTLTAMLTIPLCAQDPGAKPSQETKPAMGTEIQTPNAVWPAYIAVSEWPRAVDVVGLRLTIPYSTTQESVTGLDLGFWGESVYFEGIQINILRNLSTDGGSGIQIGLCNTVGDNELMGIQVGLWNEAQSFGGVQAGLVNIVGQARGFQVGLVNRAETLYGYQVGLINVIRDAELRFCPIVNIGF